MRPSVGKSSSFWRDFNSMLAGNLGKVLIQGAYFVIIARKLGVANFGVFAALVGLASVVAPFASVGTNSLTVRNVTTGRSRVQESVVIALSVTFVGGLTIAVALLLASRFLAPEASLPVVGLVLISDLICSRLVEACAFGFQAVIQMKVTAGVTILFHSTRLIAAVVFTSGIFGSELWNWARLYCVASLVSAGLILIVTATRLGFERPRSGRCRDDAREGFLFSVGLASQTIYNDIDKAMLGALSTPIAAGIYTAAYRVIDVAFAPMRALLGAAYPRIFIHGDEGLPAAIRFARRIAAPGFAYCAGCTAALLAGAPMVPLLLGSSFASSVPALRALAVLPILKAAQYLLADALSASGLQGRRSLAQAAVALANIAMNLYLIPNFGWQGAVASSLACDFALASALCTLVWWKRSAPQQSRISRVAA